MIVFGSGSAWTAMNIQQCTPWGRGAIGKQENAEGVSQEGGVEHVGVVHRLVIMCTYNRKSLFCLHSGSRLPLPWPTARGSCTWTLCSKAKGSVSPPQWSSSWCADLVSQLLESWENIPLPQNVTCTASPSSCGNLRTGNCCSW